MGYWTVLVYDAVRTSTGAILSVRCMVSSGIRFSHVSGYVSGTDVCSLPSSSSSSGSASLIIPSQRNSSHVRRSEVPFWVEHAGVLPSADSHEEAPV